MSEYKKVKIGDFLEQYRNTIWIDDSVEYGQITISSKDGVKFRCLKIGKEIGRKRQFVIDLKSHPNTVIFTRQGIADGSIGIAPSNVNGCIATENMPMFSVNENIILVEYLENLLISPVFKELVATITPSGSAQKSIHERDLLQLEITLPDLETQKEIVKKVSINLKNVETLTKEIEFQKAYVKQLRQNILQDAIEGKLTAEWRKTHSVIKGNPDYDAEALFEEIQKEKKYCKPEKLQEPLFFEALNLPNTWEYPTLFEITKQITDGTHLTPNYVSNGEIFLSAQNVKPFKFIPDVHKYVSKEDFESYRNNRTPELNDILMARVGAGIGEAAVIDQPLEFAFYVSLCLIKTFKDLVIPKYITCVLNSTYGTNYSKNNISSTGASAGNYNLGHIRSLKIPLPPIKEQEEILNILSRLLNKVEELEQQIKQREEYANQLVQRILKDAFEER